MKKHDKKPHILLADDDPDDRFFFNHAVRELSIPVELTSVNDGEQLIKYLFENSDTLPDVLFLDLNMPRKNGSECLTEIKADEKFRQLPVIIYSTSLHEDLANELYEKGAHFYVRKSELRELRKVLDYILNLISAKKFTRPPRDKFVLSMVEA